MEMLDDWLKIVYWDQIKHNSINFFFFFALNKLIFCQFIIFYLFFFNDLSE